MAKNIHSMGSLLWIEGMEADLPVFWRGPNERFNLLEDSGRKVDCKIVGDGIYLFRFTLTRDYGTMSYYQTYQEDMFLLAEISWKEMQKFISVHWLGRMKEELVEAWKRVNGPIPDLEIEARKASPKGFHGLWAHATDCQHSGSIIEWLLNPPDGEVCVSSLGKSKPFQDGRTVSVVMRGTTSHYFPFDCWSERMDSDPKLRFPTKFQPDHHEWDEGWLNPSESEVVSISVNFRPTLELRLLCEMMGIKLIILAKSRKSVEGLHKSPSRRPWPKLKDLFAVSSPWKGRGWDVLAQKRAKAFENEGIRIDDRFVYCQPEEIPHELWVWIWPCE